MYAIYWILIDSIKVHIWTHYYWRFFWTIILVLQDLEWIEYNNFEAINVAINDYESLYIQTRNDDAGYKCRKDFYSIVHSCFTYHLIFMATWKEIETTSLSIPGWIVPIRIVSTLLLLAHIRKSKQFIFICQSRTGQCRDRQCHSSYYNHN